MYPNGYNSWYWAPLGHKIANNLGKPTLWFNCASPATSLQDGSLVINSWSRNMNNNNSLAGKFRQTLQSFSGPFGAKAVLWHQGESDHEGLLGSQGGFSPLNYKTKLESLIDFSRTAASGSSTDASLAWYVSKVSYTPYRKLGNNTSYSTGSPLLGVDPTYLNPSDDLAWISTDLINNQTPARANVFSGPSTDGINSATTRSSKLLIHFSGSSLQTVADSWYNSLVASPTTATLIPTTPIKISSVVKSGNTYTVTVDKPSDPNRVFYWCVEQYGLNTRATETTTNSFPFTGVGSDIFLHCYVKENGRFSAVVPFFIPGGTIEAAKLTLSNSNLILGVGGGTVSTVVTASDANWDLISYPTWVTPNIIEGENEITFTASANTGSARSGTAVVQQVGGTLFQNITISQDGATATTYTNLTTLTPTSSSGYYRLNASIDNNTMRVGGTFGNPNGASFSKGFGVHANNSLFFNLNGQYTTITGKVGRDDEGDNQWGSGNVIFYIKGDGVVKWTSSIHGTGTYAQDFTGVDVSGVTTLELNCDISSDNNYFDHGDWIDPILSSGGGGGGGGCNTAPAAPTNVSASAYTVANAGQTTTLYATCAGGSIVTWGAPINLTGSPQTVSVNSTTNYTVTCVTAGCPTSNPGTLTITVGPCSGLVQNNQILGYWSGVNNHPLVNRIFNNTNWLTQRINSSPDQFLVRPIGMLTRTDVTAINGVTYANNQGCFAWNGSNYGYLETPNSSVFATPPGYSLNYECPAGVSPCNSTNGTPYYTYTGGARKAAKDTVDQTSFVTIIPNPSNGIFDVKVDLELDAPVEISIVSSNGIIFETANFEGKKGVNKIPYKAQKVSTGRYILRVKSNDKIQSTVLVIE
jgi:NPCBM/NEW2 domain